MAPFYVPGSDPGKVDVNVRRLHGMTQPTVYPDQVRLPPLQALRSSPRGSFELRRSHVIA
jgi:hypothetical protein